MQRRHYLWLPQGCGASAPDPEYEVSVDPATNTIYATNLNLPEIDVIKGATCDANSRGMRAGR